MGLIQLAEKKQAVHESHETGKKKTGLLDRILFNSGYDRIEKAFSEYMADCRCERGGLLCGSDGATLVMVLSCGFDLTTARRFSPETTSFSSMHPDTEQWYTVSGSDLEQYASFFSSREIGSLTAIHVHAIGSMPVACFVVLADSRLDMRRNVVDTGRSDLEKLVSVLGENQPALQALSRIVSVNQSADSIRTHAQSALDCRKTATMVSISFEDLFPDSMALMTDPGQQIVFNAIIHQIARQTGSSNILHLDERYVLHIVLFSTQPVDPDLYFFQLMKPLESIFGAQRVTKIRISVSGSAKSLPEILEFLNGAK